MILLYTSGIETSIGVVEPVRGHGQNAVGQVDGVIQQDLFERTVDMTGKTLIKAMRHGSEDTAGQNQGLVRFDIMFDGMGTVADDAPGIMGFKSMLKDRLNSIEPVGQGGHAHRVRG